MKIVKKVIIVILLIIIIPIIVIFAIRLINNLRYPEPDYGISKQFANDNYPVTDIFGKIETIDHNRAQGFYMQPTNKSGKGLIVVFGGSEGSANYDVAYKLYEKGYEVLAMYFFGQKNQPQTLSLVDIAFFEDIEDYIGVKKIDNSIVTLLGISKGAELSLLLTQYYENINNVVLYAPSTYVFQGLDIIQASSWLYNEQELPYCSFQNSTSGKAMGNTMGAIILGYPISYRETYKNISESISIDSSEWIYKKPVSGKILAFAGTDDEMWNSDEMGKKLKEAFPQQVELHLYENAGHIFKAYTYATGLALGGTIEANIDAETASDKILFEYIKECHK